MRKDTGLSPHSQTPICTSVWTWQGAGAWGGGGVCQEPSGVQAVDMGA